MGYKTRRAIKRRMYLVTVIYRICCSVNWGRGSADRRRRGKTMGVGYWECPGGMRGAKRHGGVDDRRRYPAYER